MDSSSTKFVSTFLEAFLYKESHSLKRCTRLIHEVNDSYCSITICKKVVNEKYMVILCEIVSTYAYGIAAVLCK